MRALTWDGTAARIEERAPPEPGPDEVRVRVTLAGICNTDLEITRGYMEFRGILGHEFVGIVDAGPPAWQGRRVVGEINFACGACNWCARGLRRHCPTRRVLGIVQADGAFAEFVTVPVANLHAVPDAVTDEAAVFVEPLAAAFEILEQIHVTADQECVVLGDGKLGVLIAQVLQQTGARILVVGRHADHLGWLARRGLATVTVDAWRRVPADVVVEATGSAAALATAVAVTKPRGMLVLKSTVAAPTALPAAAVVVNEIQIVGSRCGPFTPALRALQSGAVDVQGLVAARRSLAEGVDALRLATVPGTLKVLLAP